jgi:hypothetical protein
MKHFQTPTPQSTLRRRLMTYLVALTGACLAMLPQGLYAYDSLSFPVPANLNVPEGYKSSLRGQAVGTQNYMCLHCPSSFPPPSPCSSSGFAWSFVGPQATLFNVNGTQQIITHFLSPNPEEANMPRATWQDSRETSAVWAKAIQSSSDPEFVEPGAIPWLLLEVVGLGYGPTGGERLTDTKFIHRVNTTGGLAPSSGCDQDEDVGKREFVSYEADYIFYKKALRLE